ncbi:MAG: hypothetical protein IKJ93_02120 [Clostridia bacterium]|nr:hypothetical protein [Clostridia bacterium]
MKHIRINSKPHREVNIPSLAGGLNLRDGITNVNDNQLTDCVNMWFKNGKLRTRPSFDTDKTMTATISKLNDEYIMGIKVHSNIKKDEFTLVSAYKYSGVKGNGSNWSMHINFWWQDKTSFTDAGTAEISIPEFTWKNKQSLIKKAKSCSYFLTMNDGVVYLYISNGKEFKISKLDCNEEDSNWENVESSEMYVPTVYAHCHRTGLSSFTGTQFEGFNLIGNSYKMIYSAYNEADNDKTHPMRYKLGQSLPESGVIKVSITCCIEDDDEGKSKVITTEHKIEYGKSKYDKFKNGEVVIETFKDGNIPEDGLRLFIKYGYVGFIMASDDDTNEDEVLMAVRLDTDKKKQTYACSEDNIVITAPHKVKTSDMKKVFCMTRNIWFGNAANGINGGSRLFLCGNTVEKEKSLVVWSSLNNPLYFSENNYAYVGDKTQAVTSFGKQGENLVIFKESSTYYSYYEVNNNIVADSLINQTVVDYEANSVFFPMIQLNGSIGCDCPDTVQLCRNRLVWANSDGNVYALYSNNQYSERTIYKISDMVYPELSTKDLINAVSSDFEGHYLLCVENRIYAMDYNSYGYQYAASFSKTEDSNLQIPWYIWEYDFNNECQFFSMGNSLSVGEFIPTATGSKIVFSVLNSKKNDGKDKYLIYDSTTKNFNITEKKIKSLCTTKLFDFWSTGSLKNVDRVCLGLGNSGDAPIQVGFITEVGNTSETVTFCNVDTNERDVAFVEVKNFYPTLRAVRIFGVKIECEGSLVVDGILLRYRVLGGVK